jgi:hypothetical protein
MKKEYKWMRLLHPATAGFEMTKRVQIYLELKAKNYEYKIELEGKKV